MPNHRANLAAIKRFDQLITYLRDEMGWPIGRDSFEDVDDLFYEFTAEELGIDSKTAAKIQEIKRLRPLSSKQPWGIFFVKFEPKRLPVVALRRILSQVALKKRPSANSAERAAWSADDLLFISNYGEGGERQISFAHFARPNDARDLPTLKVLGWDNRDTALHLDAVAAELTEHLAWPDDDADVDAWRMRWRAAFTLDHREVINTSRDLSVRLAELARGIRDRIRTALVIETERGQLTTLMKAFQSALVHDLDADGFADMYAQTIAYGLLSARISDPNKRTADDLTAHMRTSPFLRDLMETFLKAGGRRGKSPHQGKGNGIDFDELGISEVVELLDAANMEAVIRDFGDRNPQEDPVIHFYELFLKEYDAKKRMSRGVFYTPRPVVSYIVRSVDELLRTDFGLADGLADITTWGELAKRDTSLKIPEGVQPDEDFVQILDPATGTGTFLVEVIDLIYKTLVTKWKAQGNGDAQVNELWNDYVPKHLLTRLHGYELLMAPYAIAHLKIGLKLYETGYLFGSEERARVFLTNALEQAAEFSGQFTFAIPALADEANAVNEVKRHGRFTVVIGNPPYSGISSNKLPWIDGLLKGNLPDGATTSSYYQVNGQSLGEQKLWLQDDYVKFIRCSQYWLTSTGVGIHGFITNHGYLDNPTFRGMRWSLMDTFDEIYILDLHGNLMKKEVPPNGGKDGNVFDIQQGVGIGLFALHPPHRESPRATKVCHADVWGDRDSKNRFLASHTCADTKWTDLETAEPFFLFEPFDEREFGSYKGWQAINEIMEVNVTGIVTARDGFVIEFDREPLRNRIIDLRSKELSDAAIRKKYFDKKGSNKYPPGDSRGWKLSEARKKLRSDTDWDSRYAPVLYRPFDVREIYYVPWMVDWPRTEAMPHMLAGENVGLIFMRQVAQGDSYSHFGLSRMPVDARAFYSNKGIMNLAPLYLYPGVSKSGDLLFQTWPPGKDGRQPNLSPSFVDVLSQVTGFAFTSDGRGDLEKRFGPEDALAYMYAVFHSPEYRRRFESILKIDFPRVPPPSTTQLFVALAKLGHILLELHLFESTVISTAIAEFRGGRAPKVEKVSWSEDTVWVDEAKTVGFRGVREEVWKFQFGGYQVCEKWLKDRKGRKLLKGDIDHYQKVIVALSETIRLMNEVDIVIDQHGGWSRAF